MPLGSVIKNTFLWYKKMFLVIGVQMTLGIFIGYTFNLLEYLIWTTQYFDIETKLLHNVDVILIFGGGAIFASIATGLLCDCISMRKVGYMSLVMCIGVFCLLYLGISSKKFETTLLLYLLNGICMFMVGCWLLCACSKIFGGKFEAFSVTIQFIGVAVSFYQLGVIMFEGRVDYELRLCLELGFLIVSAIVCIFFLKKLPEGQLEITFEESQVDQTQTTQRREEQPQPIEPQVQI